MESSPPEVSEPLQNPLAATDSRLDWTGISSPDNLDKSPAESNPAQTSDHGQADDENLSKQEGEHPKIHVQLASSALAQADVKHGLAPGDTNTMRPLIGISPVVTAVQFLRDSPNNPV